MRCPSPPESVADDRSSVKYPRPTVFKNLSRLFISRNIGPAICSSRAFRVICSKESTASSIGNDVYSAIPRPPTCTDSESERRRRPPHSLQTVGDTSSSSAMRIFSEGASFKRSRNHGSAPSHSLRYVYSPCVKLIFVLTPFRNPSRTSFGKSANGFFESAWKCLQTASSALRRYAEPCLSAVPMYPSFSGVWLASGISFSESISITVPRPWQRLHAP